MENKFLDHLRRLLKARMEYDIDTFREFVHFLHYDSLPKTNVENRLEGDEEKNEDIEFENFEILELNDGGMKMSAGGDWQEPKTFSMRYENGVMYYNDDAVDGFEKDGLTEVEMAAIIYQGSIPEKIKEYYF